MNETKKRGRGRPFLKTVTMENAKEPIVCKKHGSVIPRVSVRRASGYIHRRCPDCFKVVHKKSMGSWYAARREKLAVDRRWERRALKFKTMRAYGGKCACCGESALEFLQIDHEKGDGAAHRKATFGGSRTGCGHDMYLWLEKNNYPEGFRVLCANCNHATHHNGVCPHQFGVLLILAGEPAEVG